LLHIIRKSVKIEFYVENFEDIEVIIKPMIKANSLIVYPIYESEMLKIKKDRKDKLNKLNKI